MRGGGQSLLRSLPLIIPLSIFLSLYLFAPFLTIPSSLSDLPFGPGKPTPNPTPPPREPSRNSSTYTRLLSAYDTLFREFYDPPTGSFPTTIDWTNCPIIQIVTLSPSPNHQKFLPRLFTSQRAEDLKQQAYDDMLWVVLSWLSGVRSAAASVEEGEKWMGRAEEFWTLASAGWEEEHCEGGMIWSPWLQPYKNAITNELWIAASIEMHLASGKKESKYLAAAERGWEWLKHSNMQNSHGLWQDGFHYSSSGTCTDLNPMLYTYNQALLLSSFRSLHAATGHSSYIHAAIDLVEAMRTGLGGLVDRHDGRGVMEERCDRGGYCSQNGQMFKGIYWLHLRELCRGWKEGKVEGVLGEKCKEWREWVGVNVEAAWRSRDRRGVAGGWWEAPKKVEEVESEELRKRRREVVIDGETGEWGWRKGEGEERAVDVRNECAEEAQICEERLRGGREVRKGDVNDRGRGRTVETHAGLIGVLLAAYELGI